MKTPAPLRVLSAGAAQAVTERIIEEFKRDTGHDVIANFGAVGAMKIRITAGEPVDVIILTQAMIEELIDADLVEPESRVDLGKVGTGVAVRAGAPTPDVSSPDSLRDAILGATTLVCPDPAVATAGKVVKSLLEKLNIADKVQNRMQFFPNGYAAMSWLASSGGRSDIGITQVTEILPNKGVTYVGPLPDEFQMKTIYSAGLSCKAADPQLARNFIRRFAAPSARPLLTEAGYEVQDSAT